MILLGVILASIMTAAFAVMVASIRRCERRQDLFGQARRGYGDRFTRKVLAVHVDQRPALARRTDVAASASRAMAVR